MAKRRRHQAHHTAAKTSTKKGIPSWIKIVGAQLVGGTIGLLATAILPDSVAPYAPSAGILASKFVGGGAWSYYLVSGGAAAGLMFISRRRTVQVAAQGLGAAKRSLASGSSAGLPSGSGSVAQKGAQILQNAGVRWSVALGQPLERAGRVLRAALRFFLRDGGRSREPLSEETTERLTCGI